MHLISDGKFSIMFLIIIMHNHCVPIDCKFKLKIYDDVDKFVTTIAISRGTYSHLNR